MATPRDIPGFPGYGIDERGNGWSCRTPGPGALSSEWKPLKATVDDSNGYPYFRLRRDGKTLKRYVHRMVLETFVGPCPPGMECRHKDGVRTHCWLGNICWDTKPNNQADRAIHGTSNRGRRQHMARLSETDVREIFAVRRDEPSVTVKEIGDRYGVARTTISAVLNGQNWAWYREATMPEYDDEDPDLWLTRDIADE